MRRKALLLATLALPTILAFTSGGTSATARAGFVVAACALLVLSVIATSAPLIPRGRGGRLALAGLAGFTGFTILSRSWTPDPGGWLVATQLSIGYLAFLHAAMLQLDGSALRRLVEPGLALGTVVVISYGLLQRGLNDVVGTAESLRAGGRLYTPIGYWNAEGLLAVLGIVLCARLVADRTRPTAMRIAALAAVPALAAGLELSFSRVGIAAVAAALLLLTALDRATSRLRTLLLVVMAGGLGVATTGPFDALRAAPAAASTGGPWLALLAVTCALVALAARLVLPALGDAEAPASTALRRALIALVAVTVAVPFAAALISRNDPGASAFGASATRLTETGSNRAQYWEVAIERFAAAPLIGEGAGSFASAWLKHRTIDEKVVNAHSLPLETAAELGLAGLLLLSSMLLGVVIALRRSGDPEFAAGPAAALLAWLMASSTDWHWQVPAVTAVAIVLIALALSSERAASSEG